MIAIERYLIKNKQLKPWVKFIWYLEIKNANIHHKILPTDSIDLIINLADDMVYETGSQKIIAQPFHINGLRSQSSYIHHVGNVKTFGISFNTFGLYPFIRKSLICTQNQITNLYDYSKDLADKLKLAVSNFVNINHVVECIENALCSELKIDAQYIYNANLICDFMKISDSVTIHSFCKKYKINTKTFERMVLRYTGYNPKILHRIKRFQMATNQLIHKNSSNLADIAYNNFFTDQAHFTKEFRSFSGTSPTMFQKEKQSIKENAVYTYN